MADLPPPGDEHLVIELHEAADPVLAAAAERGVVEIADEATDDDGIPARAIRNEDGSITLPLLTPVTLRFRRAGTDQVREETTEQLVLHRLTGKDLRAISAAKKDQAIIAVARSARIAEPKFNAVFDQMDGADASAAIAVAGYFLGAGQKTGR